MGPLGRNGCWSESYTAYGVGNPAQRARGWVRAESVPYPPQHDSAHRENEVKMSRSCLLMSGTKTRAMCSVAPLDRLSRAFVLGQRRARSQCPQLSRGERVTESAKSHFRPSDHSYRSKLARVAPQAGSNPYRNQRPSRGQSNDSLLPKWASKAVTRGRPKS